MELEHRFEVPVGIDTAWTALLDMQKVAPCFPGATLDSIEGDEFSGSVKVKLGPIQLTYKGKAKVIEKDEAAHRAVIEATGNAARTSSTASMLVTATATAVSADRTAVHMTTSLNITGRPAQFGRGVMVEVGNKLIGQFADCLSGTLTGTAAGPPVASAEGGAGEIAGVVAGSAVTAPDPAAPAPAAPDAPAPDPAALAATTRPGTTPGQEGDAGDQSAAAGPRHATNYTRSPEPIDLLESAGVPILKRVAPIVIGVLLLLAFRRLLRRRKR